MAKCPDCHSIEILSFPTIGDGVCSHCYGDGRGHLAGLHEKLTGSPTECIYCYGTGQCQTCGGTGCVKDDEAEDDNEDSNVHESESDGSLSHTGGSYDSSSYSSSGDGNSWGCTFTILGVAALVILSFCHQTTAPVQQQASQYSYQPVTKDQKAYKHKTTNPPAQEEAPRQETVQPPSEKVEEHARTVREFRVPMNQSIAAANDFTAEVRLPDGRTESVAIAGLNKGNDTLYVTLAQDYPEGTVVTIYPQIEYANRFVVPGNPNILTSPSVSVTVQLPDGRFFQPCVQNIERGMTQLVVTTCDNYPTGTRVIVNPVYGGYRRY